MDTNRLEAFSDGVFAIAITLLVLEIKVPTSVLALGNELLKLWPSYLAYAVSFIVIGAIWINHHAMFDHIVRADHMLLLLNTIHLMFIAFIPFPTAVLADAFHTGTNEPLATSFYSGVLTVIGVLVTIMWYYAAHGHRLIGDNISRDEAKRHGRRFLVGPVLLWRRNSCCVSSAMGSNWVFRCIERIFLWPSRRHTTSTNAV